MKPKKTEQNIEESKEKEYLEGWQRARADLENLQKRIGADREQQRSFLKRDIVETMLPLADNFRSLVEHAPAGGQDPWVTGVIHVARQFEQALSDFGVEMINKKDIAFDPDIHEAVQEVEETGKEGKVLEVIQPGYRIGGVTIRPAKVTVGKTPSSPTEIGDPGDVDSGSSPE